MESYATADFWPINPPLSRIDIALGRWESELLDLSKGNGLIYLKAQRRDLTLTHPEPASLFKALADSSRSHSAFRPDELLEDEQATQKTEVSLILCSEPIETDSEGVAPPRRAVRTPWSTAVVSSGEPTKTDARLYMFRMKSRMTLQEHGLYT